MTGRATDEARALIEATRPTPQEPTVPVPLAQVEALAEAVAEYDAARAMRATEWSHVAAQMHTAIEVDRATRALLRSVGR